jgi:hypothetical protein
MTDLLTALQSAERGSWELDVLVHAAIGGDYPVAPEIAELRWQSYAPVTQSIDAALALVERELPGARVMVERCHDGTGWAMIQVSADSPRVMEEAPTPPLALVIALVSAKEAVS